MKWLPYCLGYLLLTCFFLSPISTQDPPDQSPVQPSPKKVTTTLCDTAHITCTNVITGSIVTDSTGSGSGTYLQAMVEHTDQTDRSSAWAENTGDKAVLRGIAEVVESVIASLALNENFSVQSVKSTHTKVATFNLFVAVHSIGDIKRAQSSGIFFAQKSCQYSGTAHVSYLPSYAPTAKDEASFKLYYVMNALKPLADKLACTIWVYTDADQPTPARLEEKTGIIWEGENNWCQKISLPIGKK